MKIYYSSGGEPSGTASGVKGMERFFDGTFVVACRDILTHLEHQIPGKVDYYRGNPEAVLAERSIKREPLIR